MKRIISVLLFICLIVGLLPLTASAMSRADYDARVSEFISDAKWKNGVSWSSSQKPKLNNSAGWSGCGAYCYDFSKVVYACTNGPKDGSRFTSISEIRTGDIIHLGGSNTSDSHWFIVLYRDGSKLQTAEGSIDGKVRISSSVYSVSGSTLSGGVTSTKKFTEGWHYNIQGDPAPGKTSKPTVSVNGSTVNVSWTYSGTGNVVDTYLIKSPWNWSDVVSSKRTTVASTGSCSFTNVADGYYQIFNIVRSDTGTAYNTNQSEWTPFTVTSTYTVSYNANGGSGAPSAQSVSAGSKCTISSTIPTRSGYAFLGWATSASATSAGYQSGASITVSGDITLYAVWKEDTYYLPLYFYANGGSGAPETAQLPVSRTTDEVRYYTLPTSVPTRSGYTFLGWSNSQYATTAKYKSGATIRYARTVPNTEEYKDVLLFLVELNVYELYAVWKVNDPKTITISFDANGGSGAPSTQTVDTGSNCTIPTTIPTRSGYTFLGWSTSASATSAAYGAGSSFAPTSNMTLYAIWKSEEQKPSSAEKYWITFSPEGGTGGPSDTTVHAGNYELPRETPTKDGFRFQSWISYEPTLLTGILPGDEIYIESDRRFYATWDQIYTEAKITFGYIGGEYQGETYSVATYPIGETIILPDIRPIRNGYSFLGWALTANATEPLYSIGSPYHVEHDDTLYAVWRKSSEQLLVFDYNGGYFDGNKYESLSATVGTVLHITTSAPNRTGYNFLGWAYSPSATSPEFTVRDLVTMTEGGLTLYAVWENATTSASIIFSDVKPSDYFADAVAWAVEKDITSGTSATTFSPNAACTRAQAVTFLWRAAGKPEPNGNATFSDVKSGSYYDKAVRWAVEKGITSGTGNGKFSPDEVCSRAQIVTLLYRFEGSPSASGGSFSDVSASAYYADAVAWGVSKGITSGTGNGKFSPDTDCTRAQIVTLLYRDMGGK